MNHGKWEPVEQYPQLDEVARELTPERLFRMTQSEYEQSIQARFWYIAKEDLWMWKSNALRAMANSGNAEYRQLIKDACGDPDERIRQMARWAEQAIG